MAVRSTKPPKLGKHARSGLARVRIAGRDYYGPAYGARKTPSPAAAEWYAALLSRWAAKGGDLPRIKRPTAAEATLAATDPDKGLTIAELADRYLTYAETYYRQPDGKPTDTYKAIAYAFRFLVGWYRMPACDFRAPQLIEVRKHVVATAGRRKWVTVREGKREVRRMERTAPARSYVNDVCNRVRTAFRWAAERGLIAGTVAHELLAVRPLRAGRGEGARETNEVPPVEDDVFFATVPHLPKVVADLLMVLRLCGARPGEVCGMRPKEIVRSHRGKPLEVWRLVPVAHKNAWRGQRREIFINQEAQEILAPYLENRDPNAFVFDTAEARQQYFDARRAGRKTPLTPSGRRRYKSAKRRFQSGPYNAQSLRHAIVRACKRAGLPAWAPNQIRHCVGTEAREIEGSPEGSQVVLGHKESATTERYALPPTGKAEKIVKKIGKKVRSRIARNLH